MRLKDLMWCYRSDWPLFVDVALTAGTLDSFGPGLVVGSLLQLSSAVAVVVG